MNDTVKAILYGIKEKLAESYYCYVEWQHPHVGGELYMVVELPTPRPGAINNNVPYKPKVHLRFMDSHIKIMLPISPIYSTQKIESVIGNVEYSDPDMYSKLCKQLVEIDNDDHAGWKHDGNGSYTCEVRAPVTLSAVNVEF